MASACSYQYVIVHILDLNDNAPFFVQTEYYGQISEGSGPGTYVSVNNSLSRYFLYLINLVFLFVYVLECLI